MIESTVIQTQTVEAAPVACSNLLIIESGSSACRCGFAGENRPRLSIPTIVGRPKPGAAAGARSSKDTYVGYDALQKRVVLNLTSPIDRGIITNWDDMETYFDYIFEEGLKIDPQSYGLLFTEPLHNPNANREKLIQIMFEKYFFKSFFLAPAPPLALYAYGYYTGVVLDSGEGQTHIVPVYEGLSMPHSTRYIPLGGKDLNNYFENILRQSGCGKYFQSNTDKETIRHMKEQLCYVALDYKSELEKAQKKTKEELKTYQLPDGNVIELKSEHFRCAEAMFEPTMVNVKTGGIHENIYRAIQLTDSSIRNLLYEHIVLSGGNTLFPGIQERLTKEMRYMAEPSAQISVHAKSDRKNLVFFGASLLGSLSKFKDMLITYPEYFEVGPAIGSITKDDWRSKRELLEAQMCRAINQTE